MEFRLPVSVEMRLCLATECASFFRVNACTNGALSLHETRMPVLV